MWDWLVSITSSVRLGDRVEYNAVKKALATDHTPVVDFKASSLLLPERGGLFNRHRETERR